MLRNALTFLTELGIETQSLPYRILVRKDQINMLGKDDVMKELRETHGKGFSWDDANETFGWYVLVSIY